MHGSVMKVNLALAVFGLGLAVMPMSAHHSVEGQYDTDKTVTIQGVVTKIEWVNPHARLWVDTSNADGTVFSWKMELPRTVNATRRWPSNNLDFARFLYRAFLDSARKNRDFETGW